MFFFNLYSADFIQADIAATADDILRDISDLSSKGSAALIMFFFKPSHSDGDSIITDQLIVFPRYQSLKKKYYCRNFQKFRRLTYYYFL